MKQIETMANEYLALSGTDSLNYLRDVWTCYGHEAAQELTDHVLGVVSLSFVNETTAAGLRQFWTALLGSPHAEWVARLATYESRKAEMLSLSVLASLSNYFAYGDPYGKAIDSSELTAEDLQTAAVWKAEYLEKELNP